MGRLSENSERLRPSVMEGRIHMVKSSQWGQNTVNHFTSDTARHFSVSGIFQFSVVHA